MYDSYARNKKKTSKFDTLEVADLTRSKGSKKRRSEKSPVRNSRRSLERSILNNNKLNNTLNPSMDNESKCVSKEQYQAMVLLVSQLLTEKRVPKQIERHYTLKSTHSSVLEKVLNRAYNL